MITLYEGKKFTNKDNTIVYTFESFKGNYIVLHMADMINGVGNIIEVSESYFNKCVEMGLYKEC